MYPVASASNCPMRYRMCERPSDVTEKKAMMGSRGVSWPVVAACLLLLFTQPAVAAGEVNEGQSDRVQKAADEVSVVASRPSPELLEEANSNPEQFQASQDMGPGSIIRLQEDTIQTATSEAVVTETQTATSEAVVTETQTATSEAVVTETQTTSSEAGVTTAQTTTSEAVVSAAPTLVKGGDNNAAIVGGVLGGVLLIVVVAFAVYAITTHKKMKKMQQAQKADAPAAAIPMVERDNPAFDNSMTQAEARDSQGSHPPPFAGNTRQEEPASPTRSSAAAPPPNNLHEDTRLSRYEVTGAQSRSPPGAPYGTPDPRPRGPPDDPRSRASEYRGYPRESRPREYPPPGGDGRSSSHHSAQPRPPSSQRPPYGSPTQASSRPYPGHEAQRPPQRSPSYYQNEGKPRSPPPSSGRQPDRRDYRRPYGPEDVY